MFDGEGYIGRIYLVDGYDGKETWFWGVSFQLAGRKSYGTSLKEAKASEVGKHPWRPSRVG